MLQFDYDSALTRMKDSLSSKFNHQEMLFFSTNLRLLEVVAEEVARMSEHDEYLTRESKWGISQNISSLLTQTPFFNYKAHRKMGATGDISVGIETTNGGWPVSIPIPRWTLFSGGGLNFVAAQDYSIPPLAANINIRVKQGIPRTKTVEITQAEFGEETDYLEILVDNPNVDNSLYTVRVNGIMWDEIDHIRDAQTDDSPVFVVNNTSDFSGVRFQFGNGVFGRKLQIGDIVRIRYLETLGEEGNVLSAGVINSVDSPIVDIEGIPVDMVCSNSEPIANGRDYEAQESIRVNAPRSYQTGDRAMTRDDYVVIIRREGLSDRVIVWGEKEINEDRGNPPGTYLPSAENLIYFSGFNIDAQTGRGIRLTGADQTQIRNTLNDLKGPTDILQFLDPQFINIVFHTTVFITDKRFSDEIVISNVDTGLRKKYSLEDAQFRRPLRFSQYYEFINSIEGVDHHNTSLSFNNIVQFRTAYEADIKINLNNILPTTIKVYGEVQTSPDEWFLIAEDDGIGNFDGAPVDPEDPEGPTYDVPGSDINYNNGEGLFRVTFGLNEAFSQYRLRIDFELDTNITNGDLLPTLRQQISYFYEANITTVQLAGNE